MEQASGEIVFWLLALGALSGWLSQLVMGKSGFGLIPNLAGGAIGSLICGLVTLSLNLPGTLLFGFLGCMSILFLANVFSVGSAHETGMKVSKQE